MNCKIFITMILDVDFLIDFFRKHSGTETRGEMGEQDAPSAAPSSAPSTGGGGSIPKWEDTYTITVGKGNPRMKSGQKWETGLTRGAANKIW